MTSFYAEYFALDYQHFLNITIIIYFNSFHIIKMRISILFFLVTFHIQLYLFMYDF